MSDAIRIAKMVKPVLRVKLNAGGNVEGYATKGAVTDTLEVDGINNFVDDHSSAIAEAMQNHFGVPVSVSKSKTPYGVSHYVKPNFDLPESETPFVVRVSDHAAWVPRLHQVEHHVYPKKTDDPRKFIGESIEAATAYGKRNGLFPKDEFVPLSGKVVHPTFGEGTVLDSKPDVAKVDFGKNGVKNISARFLQPIHKADGGSTHEPHQRAEEQGYSIKGYHFTRGQRAENIAKTGKFDPTRSFNPDEEAVFFWTHPEAANEWAHIHGSGAYPNTPMGEDALNRRNPVIMPARINPGKHLDVNWLEHSKNLQSPENYNSQLMGNLINHAKRNGYDTMRIRNMGEGMSRPHDQIAVLNPAMIRSEFAQFDPARQHENDIGAHTGGMIERLHRKDGGSDDETPPPMGHNMPPESMETSMSNEGLHPHLISQRLPTAVKSTEDPTGRHLLVNLQTAKEHQPSFSHNINLMKTYNQLHPDQMQGSDDDVAEQFINHYKDNLLAIHDAMEPGFRERTRHWYVGANKFANKLADRHGVQPSVSSAALAATSPQKDWFQNASIGERILDIHHNQHDTPYTKDMEMTANRIFGKGKFDKMLEGMRGKTYGDLKDPKQKAAFIRLFDETYHDPSYRSISPTGELGDFVKTAKGDNARMAWGSLSEISKGVKTILAGGSREANSDLMGERHKIRNFYNNILDPHSPTEDVTVDTHAVAGAHLMPYGANGTPVAHNFKNSPEAGFQAAKGSNFTGVQGTYPFYTEAVRRAAQERGVEPREMQSITWEGARALFPDTFKTPKNIAIVDGIWKSYQRGEISADDARKQILDFAGAKNGVIHDPSQGTGLEGMGGFHEREPHSSYQRKLPQADVYGEPAGMVGGVGGGASPEFTGLDPQDIRRFSRHRQLAQASQSAAGNEAVPQSYARRTGKIGALDLGFDAPVKAIHDPTDDAKAHFDSADMSAPSMFELQPHEKSAKAFHQAITAAKLSSPTGSSVHAYDPKEYRKMRLFMAPDGGAGFALKGDDIVSVFNHADSPHKNVSNAMLQLATQQGGRRLDAFDTVLPHIYSRNGFRVMSRMPWNEDYKPEGWNHADYAGFKNGRPDVVFMAYDPKRENLYDGLEGEMTNDYDKAVKLQNKGVIKFNNQIAKMTPKKAAGGSIDRKYVSSINSPIVEHALGKISAPLPALDPHLMAAIAGRRS